ncbi:hypothetical protein [Roseibacillus ishigakijimensis]|uniref:Uncharacterized protein n=1 Tax=Roseibacillus ishigakijimensis TaxID=454146 RepID=A0A934RS04_9BACT|nr:hypothetical protein [Roseibacillus ishigakijimensis]MBK1833175.1 hypothetical protein [Roseibacillus ishigakijimensis]
MNLLNVFHWSKLTLTLVALGLGILLASTPIIIIALAFLFLIRFEKRLKLKIPSGLATTFMLFIISSLVLGSYYNFYERFSWWDDVLHAFYGGAFALIGFLVIQYVSVKRGTDNDVFIVCLFSFCFSVTFGAMWEIYEFTYDSLTGGNMQRTEHGRGVNDTMHDLILESASALILNIFIYLYIASGADNLVSRIWESFLLANNPRETLREEIAKRREARRAREQS